MIGCINCNSISASLPKPAPAAFLYLSSRLASADGVDEAMSNLDPMTELDVWQARRALLAERTAWSVTPRLIGLAEAGEIVVWQPGRVIERGRP